MTPNLLKALHHPEPGAPLGYDAYGFALHDQILHSIVRSLETGILVSIVSLFFAVTLAYFISQMKGWKKHIPLILIDAIQAMPSLLFILLIACLTNSTGVPVFVALLVTTIPRKLRFAYNLILKIQKASYLEAAQAIGASPIRSLTHYYWAELKPALVPLTSWSMGYVILTEAVLSFLGMGSGAETTTLGKLLLEGKNYFIEAPHLLIFPSMTLIVILYTLNRVADLVKDS